MPFTIAFNHTPEIGFQVIVEIYDRNMLVPAGFPADLAIELCSKDVMIEEYWEPGSLDRTRWSLVFCYKDDDLVACLRLLLAKLPDSTPELLDTRILALEVKLLMDRLEFEQPDILEGLDDDLL